MALTYSFPYLEPVYCSMSSSNCCFLTCIQISQEEGQVVWYSHLLKKFPQFIVIHTVKGFGIINKFCVYSLFYFVIFEKAGKMFSQCNGILPEEQLSSLSFKGLWDCKLAQVWNLIERCDSVLLCFRLDFCSLNLELFCSYTSSI